MGNELKFLDDEERWAAVVGRDRRADGAFLYAVRTTGVYCRPSCPSRLPNRANAEFFGTCGQAERKAYRSCKRCKPAAAPAGGVPAAVVRACRMIEEADDPPTLGAVAVAVGLSPHYFHRLFKAAVGVTPKAYAAARRAERFRAGLRAGGTVTAAMYAAGFGASSRCYEAAGDDLGMTPAEYKRGGAAQAIRFAVAECALGWVAVAATGRGVCLIEFGDTPDTVRDLLAARFARATVEEGDPGFREWVRLVVAHIGEPGRGPDPALPLDIRGTAFQRKVWEALRAIPAGATATYAEIAERIGHPAAARAVARACAANELAVVVPCHRVVRADGTLSGYRWGVERKRELLDREAGRVQSEGGE